MENMVGDVGWYRYQRIRYRCRWRSRWKKSGDTSMCWTLELSVMT
jgi:hypothetical protein